MSYIVHKPANVVGEAKRANDWYWIGPFEMQRRYGVPERLAKAYAKQYGGIAQKIGA